MASKLKVVLLYLLLVTNFIILKKKEVKSVRTLFISFKNELGDIPVSAFRGAVIEKVGREHNLFHNHNNEHEFHHRYPLIQYKKNGIQPVIICLEDGVDELYKLFQQKNWDLYIIGTRLPLKIDEMKLQTLTLKVNGQLHHYELINWQGLNSRNYSIYQSLLSMADKIAFLEKILIGNILSFAKGLDWFINDQIFLTIQNIEPPKPKQFKGTTVMTFNIRFCVNMSLPDWIGLGKGASVGFGMVRLLNR